MAITLTRSRNLTNGNGDVDRFADLFESSLESVFGGSLIEPQLLRAQGWNPTLDVSESNDEFVIRAEVPSMAESDMELTIVGDTLALSGSKKEEKRTDSEKFHRCERRFGAFRRVVSLPSGADLEKISAESRDGMVTIHIPKKPGIKPKNITIKQFGKLAGLLTK